MLLDVADILKTPTDRYQALKKALLAVFGITEDGRPRHLLFDLKLDDERQSQFLRRLQSL